MPSPVGVAVYVVKPSEIGAIDTPIQHTAVQADRAAVEVIDSPSAPVPASIPAVIPPASKPDPSAKR